MAEAYLVQQGLRLRQRNYHCRQGEIDLIMDYGDLLVFAEVRFRRSARFGSAAETVTLAKQQKIQRTAQDYLMRHPQLGRRPVRFDVVAITPRADSGFDFAWLQDAFAG